MVCTEIEKIFDFFSQNPLSIQNLAVPLQSLWKRNAP